MRALLRSVVLSAGLIMLAVFAALLYPQTRFDGMARAIDGDSLRLGSAEIRLGDIDAPEFNQTCARQSGEIWPCGRAARTALARILAEGAPVTCVQSDMDRYGRSIATCRTSDGGDVAELMVRAGFAFTQGGPFGRYRKALDEAQTARRGIWQGDAEDPRDYRARHRNANP